MVTDARVVGAPPEQNDVFSVTSISVKENMFLTTNSYSALADTPDSQVSSSSYDSLTSSEALYESCDLNQDFPAKRPSRQAAIAANNKLASSIQKPPSAPRTHSVPLPSAKTPSTAMIVENSVEVEFFPEAVTSESVSPILEVDQITILTQRICALEATIASRDAEIIALRAAYMSDFEKVSLSLTNSVTSALEQKLSAQFAALDSILQAQKATPKAPSRLLSPHADPATNPQYAPKRLKSISEPATETKTYAQTLLDKFSASQIHKCFSAPKPRPGLRIVHIAGFRFVPGHPIGLFSSPRKYIFNVSPISNCLAEVIIDASSLELLRTALSAPNCPISLSTDLQADEPLYAGTSMEDANRLFNKRIDKDITRLKSKKPFMFEKMAELLATYRSSGVRTKDVVSRPSPIYMSSFIKHMEIEKTSSSPLSPSIVHDVVSTADIPLLNDMESTDVSMTQ